MSDKSKQNISELMDGELTNDCSRFLLKRLQSDDTLQSSWNNYHMLRSCLQQEHDAPLMHNLGASVISQIASDSVVIEPVQERRFNGWMKSLAGSAIAASVALVAVLTFNQTRVENSIEPLPVYAKTSEQLVNPPNAAMVRVEQPTRYTRFPTLTPQIQTYLSESNNQPQIPVYYNAEYANKIIIQTRQRARQNTAEE